MRKNFMEQPNIWNKVYTLNGGEINHEDKIENKKVLLTGLIIAGAFTTKEAGV